VKRPRFVLVATLDGPAAKASPAAPSQVTPVVAGPSSVASPIPAEPSGPEPTPCRGGEVTLELLGDTTIPNVHLYRVRG
jgi:hypothetical protein